MLPYVQRQTRAVRATSLASSADNEPDTEVNTFELFCQRLAQSQLL